MILGTNNLLWPSVDIEVKEIRIENVESRMTPSKWRNLYKASQWVWFVLCGQVKSYYWDKLNVLLKMTLYEAKRMQ